MILFESIILTKNECDEIVNSVTDWEIAALKVKSDFGNGKVMYNNKKRKSFSSFSDITKGSKLYSKINAIFNTFDYELISDKLVSNVLKYTEGNFIYKHTDFDLDFPSRFCGLVIQLSEPSSYEGGDFNYYLNDEKYTINKQIGTAVVFRPDVYHEVTTVTKGERHSFVMWIDTNEIKPLRKLALI